MESRKFTIKWEKKDIIIDYSGEIDYLSIFNQKGICLFNGYPPRYQVLKIEQVIESELVIVANINRALMIDHYKREKPYFVRDLDIYY